MEDFRLVARRKKCKEELDYYSNKNKSVREKDVIIHFLRLAGIQFSEDELITQKLNSKIDVIYKDACFQVKEITNLDMQRSGWIKDNFNQANKSNSFEGSFAKGKVTDVPNPMKAYDIIKEKVKKYTDSGAYSKETRYGLDLIFDITRTRTSFLHKADINQNDFNKFGWRSISCIHDKLIFVIFTRENAPDFLKDMQLASNAFK